MRQNTHVATYIAWFDRTDEDDLWQRLDLLENEQRKLSSLEKELLEAGIDPKHITDTDVTKKLLKIE